MREAYCFAKNIIPFYRKIHQKPSQPATENTESIWISLTMAMYKHFYKLMGKKTEI